MDTILQKSNQFQISTTVRHGNTEKHYLSVLAKKVYGIDTQGNCIPSDADDLFNHDTQYYHEAGELMMSDYELYPIKPLTDVVIKASIKGDGKQKALQCYVQVAKYEKLKINVFGKRLAYKDPAGNIRFTESELIENIPLRYDYAYGGFDAAAEAKLPPVSKEIQKGFPGVDFDYSSVYRYPRNPCGKGYVVEDSKEAFENLELPNLEDPGMPLSPKNIVLGDPELWVNQPIPRATDWVNMAWFPRIAYFGILPLYNKQKLNGPLPELYFRYAEPDILNELPMEEKFNIRACNGASMGLQFPHLKGGETIQLFNIYPAQREYAIKLPAERPRIWTDGRQGKLKETEPVIHTVQIDLEKKLVTVVWRGSAEAIRPYFYEELPSMPFKVEWR
jgi:hypothetical protein